jgi:hypothetical protein
MRLLHDYSTYEFGGTTEFRLTIGDPAADRCLLIIPPLFDEMNRMRRVLVRAAHLLATHGRFIVLPALPGTNESLSLLAEQSIAGWGSAMLAAGQDCGVTHIASFRGGALIDGCAPHLPHWRLAPAKGSSLLKTMIRTRIAGDKEAGIIVTEAQLMALAKTASIDFAGNVLGPDMVAQLASAQPEALPNMTERKLGQDIAGSPLWLRTEPQDDPVFAANIAADLDCWLDRWSASCGG